MRILQKSQILKHRILFLATYRRGGVEHFSEMLLTHLGSDFEAELLTIGNRLYQGAWRNFFRKIFDLAHAGCRLVTKLRNNDYDIIHINPSFKLYPLLRESLYLFVINGLGYGSQTVVFFHGWDGNLAGMIGRHPFYGGILRSVYSQVGVIFVLYSQCKEQLVSLGLSPEKIRITTTMYKKIWRDGDQLKTYRQPGTTMTEEKIRILLMSLFIEGKGIFIAAEVAQSLIKNGYHNFQLILAGDGPLLPEVRNLITENGISEYVSTPGYVRGTEKEEILGNSHIFLFPTQLQEGCPIVIMEAMGAGLAIVSTPRGAIPSLIKEGKNGFICDGHNPNVFYEAVRKLLDNRELLNRMRETNRKEAEENYEVEEYTRRMERVYRSVIDSGRLTV